MIIITGPTGVGKSDCALLLARQLGGEIVNADIGQCYTPLTIGTAKPDWRAHTITHHGFDWIDQPVDSSVVNFYSRTQQILQDITVRNKRAILVGGSSFYIYSLFFPPRGERGGSILRSFDSSPSSELRTQDEWVGCQDERGGPTCLSGWETIETAQLWQELFAIDPVRAREIEPHDRYRIIRALTIWHNHGQKPSDLKPVFAPVQLPAVVIVITRERQELYQRINVRTAAMISAGWLEEVAALSPAWQDFLLRKKFIGYDDIVKFLRDKQINKQDLIERIAQKTRAYAKRQLTFNRMLTKKVEEHRNSVYTLWVTVTGDHYEEIVDVICARLREHGYGVQ